MGRKQVKDIVPGRDLKYYSEYVTSIENYASACGITIKYDNMDGEGSYEPHKRWLRISPDLSQSCEIAVLLHELGHCLDDTLVSKKMEPKLSKAYNAIYKDKYTKTQLALVVACERRAWKMGRAVAKKLRIRLGKWYDEIQRFCIEDYKN